MQDESNPIISILVPVYNVERYLERCLKSIRTQSIGDIEIICVDDGSTDHSAEILVRNAEEDSRIRIITKPNGGLSSARNAGIDASAGSYLMFVDSDDILEDGACEKVVNAFNEHKADIVTFGANIYPKEASYEWLKKVLNPRRIVYKAFHTDILFREQSRPFVWRTAYSRMFIQHAGLRFEDTIHFGEDMVFLFMAYPQAQCTVFLPDKLYGYSVSRKDSLMATFDEEAFLKIKAHIDIAERILAGWRSKGWLYQYPHLMLAWTFDFLLYDIACQNTTAQKKLLQELKNVLLFAFEGIDVIGHPKTKRVTRKIYQRVFQAQESELIPPLSLQQVRLWYFLHPEPKTGLKRIVMMPIRIVRALRRRIVILFERKE